MYFLLRVRRDRRYLRRFRERLGLLKLSIQATAAGSIWLHAVSVGEVISVIEPVNAIRKLYPKAPLYVSCTTVAGRIIAEEKLSRLVDGLFYAPIDYVWCVRRVVKRLRPSLVIVMETEIWPNLYREVKRSGSALAIVNGRISDRAFPRYQQWRGVFGAVLSHPDLLLVQSPEDRRRYVELGAPPDRVEAAGNLKYDFDPADGEIAPAVRDFLEAARPAPIWIAASTMPPLDSSDVDEDDIVIAEFQKLAAAGLEHLLVLVPRRPDRFALVAAKLDRAGVRYVRRSKLPAPLPPLPCILLLDSMGELSRLFAVADLVFMGGTFPRRGGHNILEPAYFGKAVIAGPHMENFAAIAKEFTEAGALVRISEPAELSTTVARLLTDHGDRNAVGERARTLAASRRGVTARMAKRLLDLYLDTLPLRGGSAVLAPVAALWESGAARRRHRALATARTLNRPVISIGGITMGGTGKTPFADWLTIELRRQHLQPAILTRGYRRRSAEPYIILAAGSQATSELTGDEAQLYLHHGAAHLGIGADRFTCGRKLASLHKVDAFVLDDGFQHWRLTRDVDIVLIDALDPFGGASVFPRGRLREPMGALARASAFVITRAEPGLRIDPIERELRRWNPGAPVFRSYVVPLRWRDVSTGRSVSSLPFDSAVAFCGLANPDTFWQTLEDSGLDIRFRWAFGDHHRYRMLEVRRLARRALKENAGMLVTTEKDLANLGSTALRAIAPLPVYALEIGIEVKNGHELIEIVRRAIKHR